MSMNPTITSVRLRGWTGMACLVLGFAGGCSDRVLTITQHEYINTAMHAHRGRGGQTGDPLEITIVCVFKKDLEKAENDRLKPGSGITSREWYDHRPESGGQHQGRFWIPSNQIYLLTNEKGRFGKLIGSALGGSKEDGWAEKNFGGIKFPKDLHHKHSVIYVFPKFIGPTGDVMPVAPTVFHPPGAYTRRLFVEIGRRDGGDNHGQFITNTTKRKIHGSGKR